MKLINSLTVVLLMALAISCSSKVSPEEDIRRAEMAIAQGDMEVASSVASHLTSEPALSSMSASQLARLSMVYMQLSEEDNDDAGTNVATATDCYRRAFKADADSAGQYFSSLPSEQAQYGMMLSAIVGNQDNPYNPDEHMHEDSVIDGFLTDSISF